MGYGPRELELGDDDDAERQQSRYRLAARFGEVTGVILYGFYRSIRQCYTVILKVELVLKAF